MQISNISVYSRIIPTSKTNIFGFNNNKISFTSGSDTFASSTTISPEKVKELEEEVLREAKEVKEKAEEVKEAALEGAVNENWSNYKGLKDAYVTNYQREFEGKTLDVHVLQILGSELMPVVCETDPKTNIRSIYDFRPTVTTYMENKSVSPEGYITSDKYLAISKDGSSVEIHGKTSVIEGKLTREKELYMKGGKLTSIYENGTQLGNKWLWKCRYKRNEDGSWTKETNVETD